MRKLIICSILATLSALPSMAATPSILSIKDTITDNHIIYPESFDVEIKDLMSNWYLQRYTLLDSISRRPVTHEVSDQEYIKRLQQLPTVIEMPYNSIVRQYIEMYAMRRPELVEKMLSLSLYYNPIFEDALERYGLPMELKYLPIIESALNPNAVSKAGAAGLWQFMPSTATGEGLDVNSLIDERRDPYRSSEAAASLLKKYHGIFGDWPLTLAAYNCGPGNVSKAIKNSGGKQDFWEIYYYLPKETRGYVPAFIAATYIMNNFGAHGISPAVARSPIVTDTVMVSNRVHLQQISDVMGLPMEELRILNPQYRQDVIPGNIKPYTLILPSVQAYCYRVCEDSILMHDRSRYEPRLTAEPSSGQDIAQTSDISGSDAKGNYVDQLNVKYHTVKRGETLASIARTYGVTAESIRAANNLSSTKVKRGKKLKINTYKRVYTGDTAAAQDTTATTATTVMTTEPADTTATTADTKPAAASTASAPVQQTETPKATKPATAKKQTSKNKSYTVKSGDTLERIASRNGTTVAAIKSANSLKNDMIHPGQKLTIPAKGAAASGKKSSTTAKKKSTRKRR